MALRIPTVRRRDLEVVVAVDVAGRARHIRVAIRQRKTRCVVIELGPQPAIKRVTRFTGGRKLRTDVVRIRGLLIILQVARGTGR